MAGRAEARTYKVINSHAQDTSRALLEETVPARSDVPDAVLHRGDCRVILPSLPADSVQLAATSPPYNVGQRYGDDGSGDRLPLDEYLALLADVLAELKRVLRDGGVLALNLPPSIR